MIRTKLEQMIKDLQDLLAKDIEKENEDLKVEEKEVEIQEIEKLDDTNLKIEDKELEVQTDEF